MQEMGWIIDGEKGWLFKTAGLFHWQDWLLLNLFECCCESNLIQRNQADKEDRRLMQVPYKRI
jgi:hypothetical protein